jgi:hypothetical protein
MKIVKVMVNHKFNLGNYETLDIAAEAELSEHDTAFEVWSILKDNAEHWFMESKKPKPPQVPQSVAPSPVASKSSTVKPENKCPNCGKWKDTRYPICYTCHEAEKESQ